MTPARGFELVASGQKKKKKKISLFLATYNFSDQDLLTSVTLLPLES